jgi:hypothetical protein
VIPHRLDFHTPMTAMTREFQCFAQIATCFR